MNHRIWVRFARDRWEAAPLNDVLTMMSCVETSCDGMTWTRTVDLEPDDVVFELLLQAIEKEGLRLFERMPMHFDVPVPDLRCPSCGTLGVPHRKLATPDMVTICATCLAVGRVTAELQLEPLPERDRLVLEDNELFRQAQRQAQVVRQNLGRSRGNA